MQFCIITKFTFFTRNLKITFNFFFISAAVKKILAFVVFAFNRIMMLLRREINNGETFLMKNK